MAKYIYGEPFSKWTDEGLDEFLKSNSLYGEQDKIQTVLLICIMRKLDKLIELGESKITPEAVTEVKDWANGNL